MTEDRMVHAETSDGGIQIVRYDKEGKWYVEIREGYGRHGLPAERKQVSVREAALHARGLRGGRIYLNLPGGDTFERMVNA